jgi:hypothetical protein
MYATKSQAKKLDKEWSEVQFVDNEKGERVMRFTFVDPKGNTATVDVKENGEKVIDHGQPDAK